MMNDLNNTQQNRQIILDKAKNLLNITNKLLPKKDGGSRFQFYLPSESGLPRTILRAIGSKEPILIENAQTYSIFICFIKRLQNNAVIGKKSLLITDSIFLEFIIKEKLTDDCSETICNINDLQKHEFERYDEIFYFAKFDLSILLNLKKQTNKLSIAIKFTDDLTLNKSETKIFEQEFSKHKRYEFDDYINFAQYEIYNFATIFLPKDSKYNNTVFLDKCKRTNSGTNKPWAIVVKNFMQEINFMIDIFDENAIDNIVIALPYKIDSNLSVEKYYKEINKYYYCTKYYDGIELKNIYNVVITDFEGALDISKTGNLYILIIPQFDSVKNIIKNNLMFNLLNSVKDQLYIIGKDFEEYDQLVEKVEYE